MVDRSRVMAIVHAMPRHVSFIYGAIAGAVATVVTLLVAPQYAVPIGANAMFVTYLTLAYIAIPFLTAEYLLQRPDGADSPVAAIFGVTGVVVVVAIGSLFLTLNNGRAVDPVEIGLSVVSVLLGWFTVHTMTALHYAHEYYIDDPDKGGSAVLGGLDFPGHAPPDARDFLYFSYVIGMTAQVADVSISSGSMRRRVMLHGLFSFFFNTVIVAATVNVIVAITGS
ncbi:MAG: DUF1345 domain-containing protein [Devosia sp.]